MTIDIDGLNERELVELNGRIVESLRFMSQMRAHRNMLDFAIGERVMFRGDEGEEIRGVISRYNKRTVSVLAEDGRRWTVSPGLLKAVASDDQRSRNVTPAPLRV